MKHDIRWITADESTTSLEETWWQNLAREESDKISTITLNTCYCNNRRKVAKIPK